MNSGRGIWGGRFKQFHEKLVREPALLDDRIEDFGDLRDSSSSSRTTTMGAPVPAARNFSTMLAPSECCSPGKVDIRMVRSSTKATDFASRACRQPTPSSRARNRTRGRPTSDQDGALLARAAAEKSLDRHALGFHVNETPPNLLGIPLEDERREFGNLLRSRQRDNSRVRRDRLDMQQREPGNDFCRDDLRQAHLAVCEIVAIERETIGKSVIDGDRSESGLDP
jgi:hypothetical protein